MSNQTRGLQGFNVLDLLITTCQFKLPNGKDSLMHVLAVPAPSQERVVYHYLESVSIALLEAKGKKGDWKTLRVTMSASDLSVHDGKKYYTPVHAIDASVLDFLKQSLGSAPQVPGMRAVEDFTIDDAYNMIMGALFLEEARGRGMVDIEDLAKAANGDNSDLMEKLGIKLQSKKPANQDLDS
jgi:hypothetical protein